MIPTLGALIVLELPSIRHRINDELSVGAALQRGGHPPPSNLSLTIPKPVLHFVATA